MRTAIISSLDQLDRAFDPPQSRDIVMERLGSEYAALIEASPFVVLATSGPDGIECSPRGDLPGFVRIVDDRTLILPDRGTNHRLESLRNIVENGGVGLLFIIPGSGATLRVSGKASVSIDAELRGTFAVDEVLPRSVIIVTIGSVYYRMSRAMERSGIWNSSRYVEAGVIPTPGAMLPTASWEEDIDG
jgi:PPOX class probable FMN-dependent enzyme